MIEMGIKHFGWVLILLGSILFINILVFEILDMGIAGHYIQTSFWFLATGVIILGIDKIILYLRLLTEEMKNNKKDNSDER